MNLLHCYCVRLKEILPKINIPLGQKPHLWGGNTSKMVVNIIGFFCPIKSSKAITGNNLFTKFNKVSVLIFIWWHRVWIKRNQGTRQHTKEKFFVLILFCLTISSMPQCKLAKEVSLASIMCFWQFTYFNLTVTLLSLYTANIISSFGSFCTRG